ncbi:MAG TPA: hypothetical protein VGH86_04900 [Phenylobacterium sp.]
MKVLIVTMHDDAQLVIDAGDRLETYKDVQAEALLLGGGRSPAGLRRATEALARLLPRVQRVTFPRLDHMAADVTGEPELVAVELQRFFR